MAIGDAVAQFLGTGTVTYQPSSGVEVQMCALSTVGTTDAFNMYNGSTTAGLLRNDVRTDDRAAATNATYIQAYNMSVPLTNTIYVQKAGTTDLYYLGAVQTNA